MKSVKKIHLFYLLIFLIFLIRFFLIGYLPFTADEARVAYRGYTLAVTGQDELGRPFPILFNSLSDYQLPVVSYMTASGIFIFGKNDFGARFPFIFIYVLTIVLIYKISEIFSSNKDSRLFCVLIAAFSPMLIFFSQIPNETIVLTFDLLLIFYLLTRKKVNHFFLILILLFTLGTSKDSWLILLPFVIFTLVSFQVYLSRKEKLTIISMTFFLTIIVLLLFLHVPQSTRSLLENNFPIFQDTGITSVENKLRGQGLVAGWPTFLEKILFNKFQFLFIGLMSWLSYLNPAVLFGQFDKEGIKGFFSLGIFSKILIIPFIAELIFIIKQNKQKFKALIFYFLLLTFPAYFIYPSNNYQNIIFLTMPFLTIIIALGFMKFNNFLRYLIIFLMIFELLANLFYLTPEIKNASLQRPVWIEGLTKDIYSLSTNNKVAVSDDLVLDIVPLIEWYAPIPAKNNFKDLQFPYKFHQMQLSNIKIIGSDDTFFNCGVDKPTNVFISRRDVFKINKFLNIDITGITIKIYKDDLGRDIVYLLQPKICVH